MNSLIELHDTKVEATTEVGTQIILLLRVYIHRSEGRPGIDAGTGWIQAAALVFSEATFEGDFMELPADISNGLLTLDGRETPNEIALPFAHTGEIALEFSLMTGAKITIRGNSAALTLLGDAVYIEEFKP